MSASRKGRDGWEWDGCTKEDSVDEETGEISLLCEVEPIQNLWGIGISGQRRSPIASRHGSYGYVSAWCLYPRMVILLNIIRPRCSMTKPVCWEVTAGFVTSTSLIEKLGLGQGKRQGGRGSAPKDTQPTLGPPPPQCPGSSIWTIERKTQGVEAAEW